MMFVFHQRWMSPRGRHACHGHPPLTLRTPPPPHCNLTRWPLQPPPIQPPPSPPPDESSPTICMKIQVETPTITCHLPRTGFLLMKTRACVRRHSSESTHQPWLIPDTRRKIYSVVSTLRFEAQFKDCPARVSLEWACHVSRLHTFSLSR